jgi:FkbM family methyltransferase
MNLPTDAAQRALAADEPNGARRAGIYYSQFGEDILLWHFLGSRWNGFYVDVGAHDPYRYSNTALLHRYRHWRGVNIDLDARSVAAFEQVRPGDVNIQAAISDEEGEVEISTFEDGAVNTADPTLARHFEQGYALKERTVVRATTLAAILTEHLPIGQKVDLLSVDVEGLELKVLDGNDWTLFEPEFVLIERHGFNLAAARDDDLYQRLAGLGYRLIAHAFVTSLYQRA